LFVLAPATGQGLNCKIIMKEPQFRNLYLHHTQFAAELNAAVNAHLALHGMKRYADAALTGQWLFALACYLLPFTLLLIYAHSSAVWLLAICSGAGVALLSFSLAQSGAHYGVFKHKWLNSLQLFSSYLMGKPQYYWIIGHAYLHHHYTNVPEFDHENACFGLLRCSKNTCYRPWHRFQRYYAWLLYALHPVIGFFADFYLIFSYKRYDLPGRKDGHLADRLIDMLLSKSIYIAVFIWLPVHFFHFTAGMVLLIVLLINAVGGILTVPMAAGCHEFEGSEFLKCYYGVLDAEPMVHQLFATCGFSHGNKFLTWLIAGANFHTEHHLFPELPFVQYPAIARITEKTAHACGFKYHYQPSYVNLIRAHYAYLKSMGRRPEVDHRYDEQFRGHYFKHKTV